VILPADHSQLTHLKNVLQTFVSSTGLKVNFDKSFLVPINDDEEEWPSLTEALGC
jgi:hypothetical protein